MSEKSTEAIADDSQSETEQSRRDFLKKAGKFAVYTPPAVMMLMKPSYATLSKSYAGRPDGGHRARPERGHKARPERGYRARPERTHRDRDRDRREKDHG